MLVKQKFVTQTIQRVLLPLLFSSVAQASWWDNFTVMKDVQYGPSAPEIADLYLPSTVGSRPAIVMVHGGAWMAGDKTGLNFYARNFANAGIAVVNINYRLLKPDVPETAWPTQIEDAQLAVRWVRANSRTLNIDPNRICAWGDSAGGHLALLLGSLQKNVPGDRSMLFAKQSPQVNCVIDFFGPTDFTQPSARVLDGVLKPLFHGKSLAEATEQYAAASPAKLVTSQTAPTLIVQGTQDKIVLLEQSTELDSVMTQKGIPHSMMTFNGGHWFENLQPSKQKNVIDQQVLDYAKKMLRP
jgi:acetyl esterase/lipase